MRINTHTPRVKDDVVVLADWLEFEALASDNGVGSLLELARQFGIAGVGDAEDEDHAEPRQFADHPKLDEVMSELEMRSATCGDGYPFEIDGGGNYLSRKEDWSEYTYTNLLLISLIDSHRAVESAAGTVYPARLFEAICVVVAENYLGGRENGACAYHFGAPRPDGSGFSTALDLLAKTTKGRRLGDIDPSAEKDDGLDIFAWRRFPDLRSNYICLFGQCATGQDWKNKNPEPKEFLNVWLKLDTSAVNSAMFLPFTLTKVEWTKKGQSLVIFDRCRIASLVSKIENGVSHDLVRAFVSTLMAA